MSADLGHNGVRTAERGLESVLGREIGRGGGTRYMRVSPGVHSNAIADVLLSPAKVRRIEQRVSIGVELCDEGGFAPACERILKCVLGREIGRIGKAGYVRIAAQVHCDAIAYVVPTATEVGGVDQRVA